MVNQRAIDVGDECDEYEARPGRYVREVGNPELVRKRQFHRILTISSGFISYGNNARLSSCLQHAGNLSKT